MKWKERPSFTTVTRLTTKSNWENIKQMKTFLCKWACKQKGSFISMSVYHENRIVSTQSRAIGPILWLILTKGNREVAVVFYCPATVSQRELQCLSSFVRYFFLVQWPRRLVLHLHYLLAPCINFLFLLTLNYSAYAMWIC